MSLRVLAVANAKINLGLNILYKRSDGYHDIETVMQRISLSDYLLFESCKGNGLVLKCTDQSLESKDNLVLRAGNLLQEYALKALPGIKVTLYKNIPVQAGLGGGSSDAAVTLKTLNTIWRLGVDEQGLTKMASKLGSDVPFFLKSKTALACGRGEEIHDLPPLSFFWVVIALPSGLSMSTSEVYGSVNKKYFGSPSIKPLLKALKSGYNKNVTDWLSTGHTNTLESASIPGFDHIRLLKERLIKKGFNPVLSGSGPSLFILTESYKKAISIARVVEDGGAIAYLCWT